MRDIMREARHRQYIEWYLGHLRTLLSLRRRLLT